MEYIYIDEPKIIFPCFATQFAKCSDVDNYITVQRRFALTKFMLMFYRLKHMSVAKCLTFSLADYVFK